MFDTKRFLALVTIFHGATGVTLEQGTFLKPTDFNAKWIDMQCKLGHMIEVTDLKCRDCGGELSWFENAEDTGLWCAGGNGCTKMETQFSMFELKKMAVTPPSNTFTATGFDLGAEWTKGQAVSVPAPTKPLWEIRVVRGFGAGDEISGFDAQAFAKTLYTKLASAAVVNIRYGGTMLWGKQVSSASKWCQHRAIGDWSLMKEMYGTL